MKRRWQVSNSDSWSPEGYWASYSDLMAGVLLVFAVAAAAVRLDLLQKVITPTEPLKRWNEVVKQMCDDPELQGPAVHVDCETGRLIISEESLRYAINSTELSPEGRDLLRDFVPKYLDRVRHIEGFEDLFQSLEISGHTDASGGILVNTDIGGQRAAKVLKFLLSAEELRPYHELLASKAFAAGYANTRPPEGVAVPADTNDWPAARRIEIQLHLDEAGILREVKQVLDDYMAKLRGMNDAR